MGNRVRTGAGATVTKDGEDHRREPLGVHRASAAVLGAATAVTDDGRLELGTRLDNRGRQVRFLSSPKQFPVTLNSEPRMTMTLHSEVADQLQPRADEDDDGDRGSTVEPTGMGGEGSTQMPS